MIVLGYLLIACGVIITHHVMTHPELIQEEVDKTCTTVDKDIAFKVVFGMLLFIGLLQIVCGIYIII